jgi:hypothetical protein
MRFDQTGVYEVAIRLTTPILTATGETVAAETRAEFQVTVGPRDTATLQQVCERLTGTIIGRWSAEERLNAARALSYIADPVVTPFVRQVLSSTDEWTRAWWRDFYASEMMQRVRLLSAWPKVPIRSVPHSVMMACDECHPTADQTATAR